MPDDLPPGFQEIFDRHRGDGKAKGPEILTAAELEHKVFPPVRMMVPGLLIEGLTLLAGKPKVGKSWLALDVCLAVADETRFVLGEMRPVHGAVLYLVAPNEEGVP